MSLLELENLGIRYPGQPEPVIDDLSFAIEAGESVALAGESGSGKTQIALAIMGLSAGDAEIGGAIRFDGQELLTAPSNIRRSLRARGMAMVFQDPSSALNPQLRIVRQLKMILEEHGIAKGRDAEQRVVRMLERTGLPDPERQARAYPWQLSGGMRQRVMIASALIAEPRLLIADEPTTALDTTVQAQILALISDLQAETGVALLLVTHDFGVIAHSTRRLIVIDRGRAVETGATGAVIASPQDPQTRRMLEAARTHAGFAEAPATSRPVLNAESLSVVYHERPVGRIWHRQSLKAVRSADLAVKSGETLAIVGESGCGKSSLARAILGLVPPSSGRITLDGNRLAATIARRDRGSIAAMQLVFQDPVASLNPAWRVGRSIAEPLNGMSKAMRTDRVAEALARVGLPESLARRFPHQISGGQAQRAAIARALVNPPEVLICDEAVSALDAPTRQEILTLLSREQSEHELAIVFISHDLSVVRRISHRLVVMYLGHVVETGPTPAVFERPRHPYTRALLNAMLTVDTALHEVPALTGEPPSPLAPPAGCPFHPRCEYAEARCRQEPPELRRIDDELVACHRAEDIDLRPAATGTAGPAG